MRLFWFGCLSYRFEWQPGFYLFFFVCNCLWPRAYNSTFIMNTSRLQLGAFWKCFCDSTISTIYSYQMFLRPGRKYIIISYFIPCYEVAPAFLTSYLTVLHMLKLNIKNLWLLIIIHSINVLRFLCAGEGARSTVQGGNTSWLNVFLTKSAASKSFEVFIFYQLIMLWKCYLRQSATKANT